MTHGSGSLLTETTKETSNTLRLNVATVSSMQELKSESFAKSPNTTLYPTGTPRNQRSETLISVNAMTTVYELDTIDQNQCAAAIVSTDEHETSTSEWTGSINRRV
jgi:hypothetical protein